MTEEQFARLLHAIQANTAAQLELATSVAELADECAAMARAVAGEDEEMEDMSALDMAGRPIIPS